jgi:ATP-dependent RNA helicase DDX3X
LYKTGFVAVCVYGGAAARGQLSGLASGCDLLVATPGRLQDFVERGMVSLASIQFCILDEADRMLDMGFEPQIRRLVERSSMTPLSRRQTMMFSATFPASIQRLASEFMKSYVWISVGRVGSTTSSIEQRLVCTGPGKGEKMVALREALEACEGRTLVFVKKKSTAHWVAKQLKNTVNGTNNGNTVIGTTNGGGGGKLSPPPPIAAVEIHGDRSQGQREAALLDFRDGKARVLVATDVAARGLDIADVKHVVNFDLASTPDEFDSYVHRIGRTGRAGNTGNIYI